jgi:hypothetical protein
MLEIQGLSVFLKIQSPQVKKNSKILPKFYIFFSVCSQEYRRMIKDLQISSPV